MRPLGRSNKAVERRLLLVAALLLASVASAEDAQTAVSTASAVGGVVKVESKLTVTPAAVFQSNPKASPAAGKTVNGPQSHQRSH